MVAAEGAGDDDAGQGPVGIRDEPIGADRDPAPRTGVGRVVDDVPAEEAGHELGRRAAPDLDRRADLFDATRPHDGDPVGDRRAPRRGRG